MTAGEIIVSLLGTGIVTFILGKLLGKKKEDIEIALSYQEFWAKDREALLSKIKGLEDKLDILQETIEDQAKKDRKSVV